MIATNLSTSIHQSRTLNLLSNTGQNLKSKTINLPKRFRVLSCMTNLICLSISTTATSYERLRMQIVRANANRTKRYCVRILTSERKTSIQTTFWISFSLTKRYLWIMDWESWKKLRHKSKSRKSRWSENRKISWLFKKLWLRVPSSRKSVTKSQNARVSDQLAFAWIRNS